MTGVRNSSRWDMCVEHGQAGLVWESSGMESCEWRGERSLHLLYVRQLVVCLRSRSVESRSETSTASSWRCVLSESRTCFCLYYSTSVACGMLFMSIYYLCDAVAYLLMNDVCFGNLFCWRRQVICYWQYLNFVFDFIRACRNYSFILWNIEFWLNITSYKTDITPTFPLLNCVNCKFFKAFRIYHILQLCFVLLNFFFLLFSDCISYVQFNLFDKATCFIMNWSIDSINLQVVYNYATPKSTN